MDLDIYKIGRKFETGMRTLRADPTLTETNRTAIVKFVLNLSAEGCSK